MRPFCIVAGEAARVSGPELAARSEPVAVGSLLAEAAMLVETPMVRRSSRAPPCAAVHITRDAMQELMLADPSLADRLVQNLANRLTQFADELRRIDTLLGKEALAASAKGPEEAAPKVAAAQGALPVPTP